MGHEETPVDKFNARVILLTEETSLPPGITGRIKMSGAKLWIDDGTNWALVTST